MRFISWNDCSLRTRLMTTFTAVVVLSSVVGVFAVLQLGRVNATTANVTRRTLPSVRALGSIGLATARFRMATLQFVAASEAERASASEGMDKALAAIEHEQKLYEPLIASEFEEQTYNAFHPGVVRFHRNAEFLAKRFAAALSWKARATTRGR